MKKIDVISIPVTDQERSKQFYTKLGFELMVENDIGNGKRWIQMGLPGSFASITLVTWFKKMPAGCMQGLVIRSEDLDADIAELKKSGLSPGPVEETTQGKFASIYDPDGNGISLHQRIEQ